MSTTKETGAICPVCKTGQVVVEIESKFSHLTMPMSYGPASQSVFKPVLGSVHCDDPDCCVTFHAVPGQPGKVEDLLREHRSALTSIDQTGGEQPV